MRSRGTTYILAPLERGPSPLTFRFSRRYEQMGSQIRGLAQPPSRRSLP